MAVKRGYQLPSGKLSVHLLVYALNLNQGLGSTNNILKQQCSLSLSSFYGNGMLTSLETCHRRYTRGAVSLPQRQVSHCQPDGYTRSMCSTVPLVAYYLLCELSHSPCWTSDSPGRNLDTCATIRSANRPSSAMQMRLDR